MGEDDETRPRRIDTSVPHLARIYDYWLGGKDNYPADRAVAEKVIELMPETVASVRANRAFLARSVHHLVVGEGIRQFLDIGTGLPAANNTHEVAQAAAPESRIVYVDNDPIVLAHAQALLTSAPEGVCDYIDADVRDPQTILQKAAATLDFTRPVGLLLVAILHAVEDSDDPWRLVRELGDALPAGSMLVISHAANDIVTSAPATQAANQMMPDRITPRSHDQVLRFFDGWDLLEPGVVSTTEWRPGPGVTPKRMPLWAGVARKA